MENLLRLKNDIKELKERNNAVILAHNYQIDEVQEIADFVGDSLALSKIASDLKENMIVFCGVKFMAETAKILSPDKEVLLPVEDAGCPMADMVTAEKLKIVKKQYPNAKVVCYVNSSAEVKAESDVCCTSSNAVDIVKKIKADQILFVPDQNLGSYVVKQVPEKEIILWQGYCPTHNRIIEEDVISIKREYPNSSVLVHPECRPEVLKYADFIGSTAQIIKKAEEFDEDKLIIATEKGILYSLNKQNNNKEFILLSDRLTCVNMKKINLEHVKKALQNHAYKIEVSEDVRKKAFKALKKMISL